MAAGERDVLTLERQCAGNHCGDRGQRIIKK
jgi:hypothetical protein